MFRTAPTGWVEVICGSMFSGKSEELIRRVRQAVYGNLSVTVFKPAIDDRYAKEKVVSHNGHSIMAYPVDKAEEIISLVSQSKPLDIIAIDEVQFFDDQIVSVVEQLANEGKRVIAAGLDTDFRGEPFPQMSTLMAQSESVTKLNAICPICGSSASRTQRLVNGKPAPYDAPIILVGTSESYEPRCRQHHEVPKK